MDNNYYKILKSNPEYISKEKFCEICKISKKYAAYYFKNNMITHKTNGKKTHKYSISIVDVIILLKDRESNPEKYRYIVPQEYEEDISFDTLNYDIEKMRLFYTEKLNDYPDLLSTIDMNEITGYSYKRILKWIHGGKIQSFRKDTKHIVIKGKFIDFISSIDYNHVNSMSRKHREMLIEFEKTNNQKYEDKEEENE